MNSAKRAKTRAFAELLTELPRVGQVASLRETLTQLDAGIWAAVHEACCNSPREAQQKFGLPPRLVDTIKGLTLEKAILMANGNRLSFMPVCSDTVMSKVDQAYSEALEPSAISRTTDPLSTHYWQTASRVASTSSIETSAALGLPEPLALLLARPDATVTRITQLLPVLSLMPFKPRLAPEKLRRILISTSARSELWRINAGLSGRAGWEHTSKKTDSRIPGYPAKTSASIKNLQAKSVAVQLLERGYSRRIVQIETGLTEKTVSTLCRSLRESSQAGRAGMHLKRKNSRGIIKNTRDYIVASILMQSYVVHCHEIDPYASIDLLALEAALEHHRECVAALNAQEAKPAWTALGTSDAWELANELRSGTALMRECDDCGGSFYDGCDLYIRRDCPHCYYEMKEEWKLKKKVTQLPVGDNKSQ